MLQQYPVFFGKDQVGKVQVLRDGLYSRFICRCCLSGDIMCRLHVRAGGGWISLGVVVPVDSGFGLDTKLPAKRLGKEEPEFLLLPAAQRPAEDSFAPICPEEPFAYISRLKHSFLVKQAGQIGILLTDDSTQNAASGGN